MGTEIINSYITARYDRWLDYSKYHCSLACMPDEAVDVLNEVLVMLLEKDLAYLLRMHEAKKGRYRELDYFVLQMIKLNITSVPEDTSHPGSSSKPVRGRAAPGHRSRRPHRPSRPGNRHNLSCRRGCARACRGRRNAGKTPTA